METYEVCGNEYPVKGYLRLTDTRGKPTGAVMPLVDIRWVQDYEWQLGVLKSRIENPQYYEESENVAETKELLKTWLFERTTKERYLQFKEKYKCCYDFILSEIFAKIFSK